jgi:hypothetical protein
MNGLPSLMKPRDTTKSFAFVALNVFGSGLQNELHCTLPQLWNIRTDSMVSPQRKPIRGHYVLGILRDGLRRVICVVDVEPN